MKSAQKPPEPRRALAHALARGDLVDQHYLGRSMAWRGKPQRLLRNGQQLITKLFRYRCEPEPSDPEVGTIARYARGSDYHVQLKGAMQAFGESLRAQYGSKLRFRAVTDSAPVLERHLAWQQGGGWFGRQSSIIHPDFGASSLIAELVVDQPIEVETKPVHPDRCGTCRACVQVCPTEAIAPDGYRVDSRRCISFWTIEWDGMIPRWIMERMGQRIFGCDDCTVICPWNAKANAPVLDGLEPHRENLRPRLLELLAYREAPVFKQRFDGTPILRTGPIGFCRNILIGLASLDQAAARTAIQKFLSHDPEPIIRATAVWAAHRQGMPIDEGLRDSSDLVRELTVELLNGVPSEPPSPIVKSLHF